MQSEIERRAYLRAMGIDVWVPRDEPDPASEAMETEAPEAPADWDSLRSAVSCCTRCPLHQSRTQTVFGVGNTQADWMIIGEAPGAEEDRRGEPFVGRAGKLLDEMLRAVRTKPRAASLSPISSSADRRTIAIRNRKKSAAVSRLPRTPDRACTAEESSWR